MHLRQFVPESDFDTIRDWINDARTHAMWCANRFSFPLERSNFISVLDSHAATTGDTAFAAVADNGRVVGFFCYSLNRDTNEGMLKFVVVDPQQRGKGTAAEMLELAAEYAFDNTKAAALHLNVFPENTRAVRCYEKVGFTERNTTPDAFAYGDEHWGRCNMVKYR